MTDRKITIRVYTAAGTNASEIGEAHASGLASWRNSVDRCDADGGGRVFIDCDDDVADEIQTRLDDDDRVTGHELME